jgi:hypothetical protein
MCRFVNEVQNKKGEKYPLKMIHQILPGIQCVILQSSPDIAKILDLKTICSEIVTKCDNTYCQLHSEGLEATTDHAESFTIEDENKFWSSEIFC